MRRFIQIFFTLLPAIFFSCFLGNDGGNEDEIPVSSRLSNPVTLDGQITSSDEWVETNAYDISLNMVCCWSTNREVVENVAVMTVRFKNDDLWLYALYKIAWSPSDIDSNDGAYIELFTGPYGPPWPESDNGSLSFGGETTDSYGWDDLQWYRDTDVGGQNDVEGAASYDGAFYWFEFRKKLDSGDGYDWALKPHQIVGDPNAPHGDPHLMAGVYDSSLVVVYEQYLSLQLSK